MTLWLLPLVPVVGAVATFMTGRVIPRAAAERRAYAAGAMGTALLIATWSLALWAAVSLPAARWPWWGPVLRPHVAVAGVGRMMIVLVPTIAIPVVLYAGSSMREDEGLARLLALLLAFTGAMELLVIAADFLTLLVGWELVGAASWALIGFEWRDERRPRAALDAFIVVRFGDLGLYLAAAALVCATGSLDISSLGALHGLALSVVAGGILVAAAAKSAQLPFSPWLFSAMSGPTPASALLHSATMVAAGAYLLARTAPGLADAQWFGPAVAWLGLATAVAAGVVATLQSDLKRALAASTSAQYGLMLVAIGVGVPAAAAVHLVAHAAFKALLFLAAGVVLHAAGTLDLSRLRLGDALPRVARLFGLGTLALAAVPPLGGAFSKEQLLSAAANGPMGTPVLAAGVLVAGFLSAIYAGRLQLLVFGLPIGTNGTRAPTSGTRATGSPPTRIVLASLGLLGFISIALGALWITGGPWAAHWMAAGGLAHGSTDLIVASMVTIAAAGLMDWLLWRRDLLFTFGVPEGARRRVADWLGIPTLASRLIVRPALAIADSLATLDEQIVAGATRAAGRLAMQISRVAARDGERGLDCVVGLVASSAEGIAHASAASDDRGIDGAVEQLALGVGAIGRASRRLQTGLTHQYYVILAIGLVMIVVAAAVGRSTFHLTYGYSFSAISGR